LLLMGKGLTKGFAGLAQAAFNVGGCIVGLSVGAFLDSRWKRWAIAASVAALPAILIAMAQSQPSAGLQTALAFALGGAILAQQVILFAVASGAHPTAMGGTVLGAAVAVGRIGSLIGPLIAAWLVTIGRTPSQVLTGILPIVVVCGACVCVLGMRRARQPRPTAQSAYRGR
jgi:AAHS family 3-hydroxyphenylpropionic acid transporter